MGYFFLFFTHLTLLCIGTYLSFNQENNMGFSSTVTQSPSIKPSFNIGCLFDIPTGTPVLGMRGETITNGGVHPETGVTGEPNCAKTGNSLFQLFTLNERYPESDTTAFDTENTLPKFRLLQSARQCAPSLLYSPEEYEEKKEEWSLDEYSLKRVTLTGLDTYSGSGFWEAFKQYGMEREKNKEQKLTTPFMKSDNTPVEIFAPSFAFIDSISMLQPDNQLAVQVKGDAGSSDRNMESMQGARAKSQMIGEMPRLTARYGLYFFMTVHLGKQFSLDPRQPPKKQLSLLSSDVKMKGVPENFGFLVHNLWYLRSMKPLLNKGTRGPEYPRDASETNDDENVDLQYITCMNIRGKSGQSGVVFDILLSQTEGIQPALTEFHYIKENDRFGLGGNLQNYYLELMPDVKLSRTTVRSKLDESYELRTATRITADLLQIKKYWITLPEGLWCDPKTLYEDIKALGYDWNVLLNTRGYWTFNQYEHPIPFLSTMDLLNMRAGTYKPYWLK